MAEVSRTARVIQNAKVALFFYCINLILQFFSRKIFLDYLGSELLGLNTTAQNLLQFLNLAESGIGAAVAFALYKPLSQKNRQEIIDIVSLQGWFYRWVGLFVIAGSIVLMAFFPWIFAKANIPLVYAYGTFIAFLVSALLGYFVNYKIIVLSADQKEYKITIRTQGIKILKICIQIFAVYKLTHGYLYWMLLEAVAAVLTSLCLNYCVKQEYPWLQPKIPKWTDLRSRYSFLLTKTKQLFFHKMGGFVLTQTTPLVIYGFTTLTMVAVYGNYMVIMTGCLALMDVFSRGFYAGVGNLVITGDHKLIKKIFWQIVTIRMFLAGMICLSIFLLSETFIRLWVGEDYIMAQLPMFLMVLIYFIQMSRCSDIFLWAYGLFQDIWAPICECVLNLGLSILLGYFWGLAGIFLGVLVSQVVVVLCWKIYFLCEMGFRESVGPYVIKYLKKLALLLCTIIAVSFIDYYLTFTVKGYIDWVCAALLAVSIYSVIGSMIFFLFDQDFRLVCDKIFLLVKDKLIR